MALTNKLTAIANAIRSKTGKTGTMTLDQMPTEIESIRSVGVGGGLEPFKIDVGDNALLYSAFLELLKQIGGGVITEIRTSGSFDSAFKNSNDIGFKIPDIVHYGTTDYSMNSMFYFSKIKSENLPKLVSTAGITSIQKLFESSYLESIPADFFDYVNCWFQKTTNNCSYVFNNCRYIRVIPKQALSKIYNVASSVSSSTLFYGFNCCNVLNELDGITLGYTSEAIDSNVFQYTFYGCSMLKRIVFATDGNQPYVLKMKTQTINLSNHVGYASDAASITNYSSMTSENHAWNDDTYNNLKNTEEWFTTIVDYSRYNKISAIETINSLPDTSAYLASAGGTNTIKFKGASGSKTDGGAINTMTAEEIAVATAKGWTVTFA